MLKRKIILFGGTFDPVHIGHTEVAKAAMDNIGAEKVIFVPAKCSPLKKTGPVASEEDRCEMLRLATTKEGGFEVSRYELEKDEASYTLETIRHFKKKFGDEADIYWLVGADSVSELGDWYKIEELIDECNLCVMYRAGFEKPEFTRYKKIWTERQLKKLRNNIIETPLIDISSSEIRRRIKAGEDVSNIVCPAVRDYIFEHKLYMG
jgi:nicotinate-nucleotide adenylyltransferase